MIEIMFGESEAGSMKFAKNYHKPDKNHGSIGWIGEKPSKAELEKMFQRFSEGEAVGGNSSEVVCLPFMLDIGDINEPIDSEYRKNLILSIYSIPEADESVRHNWLQEAWERYLKELGRLKSFALQGENLRIWYSDAPYSMCGFYYVCNLLKDYPCKLSVIKLPPSIRLSDNVIQFSKTWGEIDAGRFYQFLPLEQELCTLEISIFAQRWSELREDRSTLRAVVSGEVIGVPEDFYDHIIRKEIPEGEISMALLIGNSLGNHPLGVSNFWYAKRITEMIEQGELEIVQKQEIPYRHILKKHGVISNAEKR